MKNFQQDRALDPHVPTPSFTPDGESSLHAEGVPDHAERVRREVTDVVNVARRLGMMDGHRRRADGIVVRCPWHREREPSCALTLGPGRKLCAYCFSCHRGGDVLSLVAAVHGLHWSRDSSKVLRLAAEKFGLWSLLFEMDHAPAAGAGVAVEAKEDPPEQASRSAALQKSERGGIDIILKC